MRFSTVIECAVIVAAASVAAASDYRDAADRATMTARYATCEAQSLPVLTPWPEYEWYRAFALNRAALATEIAQEALQDADYADKWLEEVTYQQMLRASGKQWSWTQLNDAQSQYDAWRSKSLNDSRRSESASVSSRNAATTCRMFLADQ